MSVVQSIAQLVGHTPLLEPVRLIASESCHGRVLLKLESFNPAGSVKDRVALAMLDDAQARGVLHSDSVIVEPTSGNTGIGLAAMAAVRGLRVILTMPETMSVERRMLLSAYGAEIVLTPGSEGMEGAITKAKALAESTPNAWMPSQFENPANPAIHARTTGVEIWDDTQGTVDVFVAGVGTGGTISGVGQYLKQKRPSIEIVAVEPAASPVLSAGEKGAHGLQGIGAGFVPRTLDTTIYDRIVTVTEQEAYAACRKLAKLEGILVGISSGAALVAALSLAHTPCYAGKCIVALLPDSGERYLSTPLFSEK